MLRKPEEGKFSHYRLNAPHPNTQLRSSDSEGSNYWDESISFRLGRNSNASSVESHPRRPRVTQPMNRSIRNSIARTSRYQKVLWRN